MTKLLTARDVCDLCRISRSRLYYLVKAGQFPAGVLISRNSRRWTADQVEAWIAAKIAAADVADKTFGESARASSRRAVEARLARRSQG
ncbi:helix-turn-helix transcriptional regulator [Pelomicrobium methylotrophicum]|uniref:Helix-turn-helix domain-containing protein n=1 Tax=Pelomicrobium methylotrophicum TaxID=2602750 RepID=A0A5C7EMI9_9PROT|nr:helix-turn-helix domain-containing protein [Pelomicrobium methylotrophicum]TXF13703.1 helix-turn-helix domain-containing protein [Pelomicrobium methylotrophicum]